MKVSGFFCLIFVSRRVVARGEIRTPVEGSKGIVHRNQESIVVKDIEWTVADFWQYCKIEERLSRTVSKPYKNIAKRFLNFCNGNISRQSIREYLKTYLQKTPATYNNQISALTAFVTRYLQKHELMKGFKRCHVPNNYETNLPTKQQLKLAFKALDNDQERAIYLMFASSGLRHRELLNLTKDDVDFETRCIKSKHDTKTKRAGVTFYNHECENYLKKYLATRTDDSKILFNICFNQFRMIWIKATRAANIKITPQILRKWNATTLGELMVPDRFVDVFQGRAPKNVLAKHYTGIGFDVLKGIYIEANLRVFTQN